MHIDSIALILLYASRVSALASRNESSRRNRSRLPASLVVAKPLSSQTREVPRAKTSKYTIPSDHASYILYFLISNDESVCCSGCSLFARKRDSGGAKSGVS